MSMFVSVTTVLFLALCVSAQDRSLVDTLTDEFLNGQDVCFSNTGDQTEPAYQYLATFEGGDEFFDEKFVGLTSATDTAANGLKRLPLDWRSIAPNDEVSAAIEPIYHNQKVLKSNILSVRTLLGINSRLIFAYDDAFLVAAKDSHSADFQSPASYWSFTHTCDDWTASYTTVQLNFTDLQMITKIVIKVEIDLSFVDLNQCDDSGDEGMKSTHLCPDFTTCRNTDVQGFQIGSYECVCSNCSVCRPISGKEAIKALIPNGDANSLTDRCTEVVPSLGGETIPLLIVILLVIQGLCVLTCLIFAIVVIIFRSSKSIQSAKCLILQIILVGAIIIYCSLILVYIPATTITCLVKPWLRELGFICIYGALILKTYKVLAEFQTRKARRVHVRDKDLLKYWFVCLGLVIVYLAAWTASHVHYIYTQDRSIVTIILLEDYKLLYRCTITGWNYVTQFTELVFIIFGLYMSWRLRTASSLFWESRYIAASLSVELIVSLAYYIISQILELNGQWRFVLNFAHIQLTITVVLLLIYAPKFYYIRNQPTDNAFVVASRRGNTTDHVDFRTRGHVADGEIDIDDINIADMNPEEIRSELRRVYEQLQSLKVTVMRYENPHIQGKRKRAKERIPFYKQISKHGFSKRSQRDHEAGPDEPTNDNQELEPLNTTKQDTDHCESPHQTSF